MDALRAVECGKMSLTSDQFADLAASVNVLSSGQTEPVQMTQCQIGSVDTGQQMTRQLSELTAVDMTVDKIASDMIGLVCHTLDNILCLFMWLELWSNDASCVVSTTSGKILPTVMMTMPSHVPNFFSTSIISLLTLPTLSL